MLDIILPAGIENHTGRHHQSFEMSHCTFDIQWLRGHFVHAMKQNYPLEHIPFHMRDNQYDCGLYRHNGHNTLLDKFVIDKHSRKPIYHRLLISQAISRQRCHFCEE